MKRSAPMKRTGFKPKGWQPRPAKQIEDYTPAPRAVAVARTDQRARLVVQHPKCEPVRHEGYRRLVATLPCIHCGTAGRSQAAHPNTGKGMALKTDDRECFPLCGPMVLAPGCHTLFDLGTLYARDARRKVEPAWGFATRTAIRLAGQWPVDLAPWPEDEQVPA